MTKTDQIRSMPHLSYREVAAIVGCKPVYVAFVRSSGKKPEHYRKMRTEAHRRWSRKYPEKVAAIARRQYHRTKVLGGPGEWSSTLTNELKMRLERGQSFGTIAKAMGFSRSTIAGRVHRLKKAGELV
jgi:hypothetical protein